MEKRPRRQVGRPSKKKIESATQQYQVADIDPHNYDVFETRYRQYMAKPSHTGEKWSVKFGARSAPVSPKDTSDMDTDEGQMITQKVLQTALEHERKRQRSQNLQRSRSETDLLYEEIIPEQTVLPGPFESILNKEEKDLEKKGDSTIRAEMTMPKSPIMGEAAQAKSPAQEETESLVSAMVKDIQAEKERRIEQSPPLERTIVQADVDFDKRCEEASAKEKDTVKWPPAMVYSITPQTSSGEETYKQYRETPPVLDYYGFSPKVTQSPALFTNAVQGTSAFVVPAKKAITQVKDSDKDSISGRAPLLLTPAFEEEVEKPLVQTDILTPTKLTKDGNPAVIVKTDSWYDAYKTQYFAVDKVNGTIYAIKEDGQWESNRRKGYHRCKHPSYFYVHYPVGRK